MDHGERRGRRLRPSRRFTLIIWEKHRKELPAESGSSPRVVEERLGGPGRREETTNTRVIMCRLSLSIAFMKIFPLRESRPAGCFSRRSLGLLGVAAVSVWVLSRPRVDVSSSTARLFIHIWVSRTSRTTAKVPAHLSSQVWLEPLVQFVLFQYFELHDHLHLHQAGPSE